MATTLVMEPVYTDSLSSSRRASKDLDSGRIGGGAASLIGIAAGVAIEAGATGCSTSSILSPRVAEDLNIIVNAGVTGTPVEGKTLPITTASASASALPLPLPPTLTLTLIPTLIPPISKDPRDSTPLRWKGHLVLPIQQL